jgi:hypothetical protein
MSWAPSVEAAKQALLREMDAYAISVPVIGDIKPFARDKMDPVVDRLIGVVSEGTRAQIQASTMGLRSEVRTATTSIAGPLVLAFVGLAVGVGAVVSSLSK